MGLAATIVSGRSPASMLTRSLLPPRPQPASVYRLKPERRDGVLLEVRTPAWPHLFRHGAATAMLEDSDDDAVFVRDQLGHRNIRETLHYAALSDAKRREKAARLRIAPETWT